MVPVAFKGNARLCVWSGKLQSNTIIRRRWCYMAPIIVLNIGKKPKVIAILFVSGACASFSFSINMLTWWAHTQHMTAIICKTHVEVWWTHKEKHIIDDDIGPEIVCHCRSVLRTHLSSCEFFERLCLGSRGAVRTFLGLLSPYSSSTEKGRHTQALVSCWTVQYIIIILVTRCIT